MTMPNFVGIGAQRAATTWIYSCLKEHPEIFVPGTKELGFFNQHFDRGLAWYEEQFAGAEGQKAVGEITPGYLNSEPAIRRLAEVLPHARLFAVLREPIQRAYSAYQLFGESHRQFDFGNACLRSHHLVEMSLYADKIEQVFARFGRDRVKVLLFDDIQDDPAAAIGSLYEFLGVDPSFRPASAEKIVNRVVFPRAQAMIGKIGLGWCVKALKKSPVAELIKRQHKAAGRRSEADVRAACPDEVKDRFRSDIAKLERLIGRDLSHWR